MKKVKIGIDVLPYQQDIWSICDYSGEQIYNKIALPLFCYKDGNLIFLAAAQAFHTHAYLDIDIRGDLFWSNGEVITAEDYVRAILRVCCDTKNRYYRLLASVLHHPDFNAQGDQTAIFAITKNKLRIKTAWYDPFLPHYLSLLNFSPCNANEAGLSAGPYYFRSTSACGYELAANPFFRLSCAAEKVDTLEYCLIEDDKDGCAFFDDQIQVSCDTAVDLTCFRRYMSHPDFHRGKETLAIILSPGDCFEELSPETLERLVQTVDRDRIARSYGSSLVPLHSWMQLYRIPFKPRKAQPISPGSYHQTLSVAYEDFYPNSELLEYIAEDITPFGLRLEMKQDEYGDWSSSCHLRLEIRKIPQHNPMLLVRSDISRLPPHSKCETEVKRLYQQLFYSGNSVKHEAVFSKIDTHLREENLYIPLFVFPTGYFCHQNIDPGTLMQVGTHVLTKGTRISEAQD